MKASAGGLAACIACTLLCLLLPGRGLTEGGPDAIYHWNVTGGRYYHLDAQCETVHESFLPMKWFRAEALAEAPYSRLSPCPYCLEEAAAPRAEAGQRQDATWTEAAAEPGPFYTWSLEGKARAYPGVYLVPSGEDMTPEQAAEAAAGAVAEAYGIPVEDARSLTPHLSFYAVVGSQNETLHCYEVLFTQAGADGRFVYAAEILSETGAVRALEKYDTP